MSDKEIFMQVDELGDLYLYDVLLTYIYPRVFVCEDIYGTKYLFYEVDSKDNKDTWVVTKITKKDYYSLVDKKRSIQKPYENKNHHNVFAISKTYGDAEDVVELTHSVNEWLKKLPKEPVYADKEIIDDVIQDTLKAARETGTTTFDIRLFPGTDRHFIPQNIMSDLCSAMTSLTSSVFGNKRMEALRVATEPGSCVVRFSFPDQINLFNETDADNELSIINEVLLSDSFPEGLEKVKYKTRFIRSYVKILNSIRKTNNDVQFTTASPNSTEVKRVALSTTVIKNKYESIKDIRKVETETVKLRGTLIALDIKTKRFKLQAKDGSIKAGIVADELLTNGSFELPKEYSTCIDIERIYNASENSIKENYCLKELLA